MVDKRTRAAATGNGAELGDSSELQRCVREHLTAAAVMVELDHPLPPSMRALEARRYLDQTDFDLALVDDERLRVLMRGRLRRLGRADLGRPIAEVADSPKRDANPADPGRSAQTAR